MSAYQQSQYEALGTQPFNIIHMMLLEGTNWPTRAHV